MGRLKKFWQQLGPGLVTGAADDDPSGIVIYSIAGAKFGLALLWATIVTLPFMIITQRIAGRIGLISGKGLAGNMKKFYPRWILLAIALMMLAANIINIGADISAMAVASNILVPGIPPVVFLILVSGTIITLLIRLPYRKVANYLKWVALAMVSYIVAAFLVKQDWSLIVYRLFVPQIIWSKEYLVLVVAFFGTTISPYLFFWQASGEVEEEQIHLKNNPGSAAMIPGTQPHPKHRSERIIKNEISYMYKDIGLGMFFSNLITFFIIILSSATLFKIGHGGVQTIQEIASALQPLAGKYSNALFLIGILASGALAVPVLAGSAAYIITEVFNWRWGFEHKFHNAPQFYMVIILATVFGAVIPIFGLHPVQILFYTAVIYGFISPPLLLLLIHMANNPKVMGQYTSRLHSNVIAYALFLMMTGSLILMAIL